MGGVEVNNYKQEGERHSAAQSRIRQSHGGKKRGTKGGAIEVAKKEERH